MISGDESNSEKSLEQSSSTGDKSNGKKGTVKKKKTNYEIFLECTSPSIPVQYYNESIGSSSSSAVVAPGAEAEEVRKPLIVLEDVWSAYEEWSCYGLGVPLSLGSINSMITQHYTPSLSAIQIFTIKPFPGDDSSSRSLSIGKDVAGSSSAKTDSKPGILSPDVLGNLYFQYNETKMPFQRDTFTPKIGELAEQYPGLNSLTSSDLSPYSWFSVAWYPIYPIPPVKNKMKDLSAAFLTYHSLTPSFTGENDEDDKNRKQEVPSVRLPLFAALTYKAFGDVWIMPTSSDRQMKTKREEFATSWLRTMGFYHNDYNFFRSRG